MALSSFPICDDLFDYVIDLKFLMYVFFLFVFSCTRKGQWISTVNWWLRWKHFNTEITDFRLVALNVKWEKILNYCTLSEFPLCVQQRVRKNAITVPSIPRLCQYCILPVVCIIWNIYIWILHYHNLKALIWHPQHKTGLWNIFQVKNLLTCRLLECLYFCKQ
jgi:hypothetical protein